AADRDARGLELLAHGLALRGGQRQLNAVRMRRAQFHGVHTDVGEVPDDRRDVPVLGDVVGDGAELERVARLRRRLRRRAGNGRRRAKGGQGRHGEAGGEEVTAGGTHGNGPFFRGSLRDAETIPHLSREASDTLPRTPCSFDSVPSSSWRRRRSSWPPHARLRTRRPITRGPRTAATAAMASTRPPRRSLLTTSGGSRSPGHTAPATRVPTIVRRSSATRS